MPQQPRCTSTSAIPWGPVWGVCGIAAAILFSYATCRPATESLFLEDYGSEFLPWAWFGVAIAVTVVVGIYSRAAKRIGGAPEGEVVPRLFVRSALWSAGIASALLLACQAEVRGASFALYIWKDVHIVVLVEIVWTFANAVFRISTARWVYGLFCACGSLGGVVGNLVGGQVALAFGTMATLWLCVPTLFLLSVLIWRLRGRLATLLLSGAAVAVSNVGVSGAGVSGAEVSGADGKVPMERQRSYVVWMLVMVASVQVAVALVDYRYNAALEQLFVNVDVRTAMNGRVYAWIEGLALTLQLGTGVLLRGMGVSGTLLLMPTIQLLLVGAAMVVPGFAAAAGSKVGIKSLDYSVARAAKEILYIPLDGALRVRGKAWVDMWAYRVSKGGASLLLGGVVLAGAPFLVGPLTLGCIGLWGIAAWVLGRRFRARVLP